MLHHTCPLRGSWTKPKYSLQVGSKLLAPMNNSVSKPTLPLPNNSHASTQLRHPNCTRHQFAQPTGNVGCVDSSVCSLSSLPLCQITRLLQRYYAGGWLLRLIRPRYLEGHLPRSEQLKLLRREPSSHERFARFYLPVRSNNLPELA